MSHRRAALLLVLVAWIVLPALCIGGLLDHACACDGIECGHEASCAADPCSPVHRPAQSRDLPSVARALPSRWGSPSTCAAARGLARAGLGSASAREARARARATDAPPRPVRVFHESDLPLRI